MCGRATDTKNELPSGLQFTLPALRDFHPRYNVVPTQPIRILRIVAGQPEQRYARWGLVPAFAKAELGAFPVWKFPTFNARSEELESKPSFRHTLAGQRCLVLIDGFYEWTGTTGSKVAHYIYLPSHATFAIAGLWDHWRSKDGKREFTSCTMLTQGAGTFMRALHTTKQTRTGDRFSVAWDLRSSSTPSMATSITAAPRGPRALRHSTHDPAVAVDGLPSPA